jgi:integrase
MSHQLLVGLLTAGGLMTKRQFGTIRKPPSGRWQVRYRTESGRRVTATETFRTRGDASRWLAKAEAEQGRGWIDPRAGEVLLADYATQWIDGRANLSPRTREIYEHQLRSHVLPRVAEGVRPLGEQRLDRLTPELVRAWYAALVRTHGRSVAAKAYVRLRQVLGQAVDDERIARNPCRIDGGGMEHHPEQRTVTIAQLDGLADAVDGRYRALVLCAGLGGIREGELFALRRSDVDLEGGLIRVRRKRLRLASGQVIEGQPKSRAGVRDVVLPVQAVDELREHLECWARPEPEAYVFTSPEGMPLERNNFRTRVWLPATAMLGLDGLKFHELRHTAGTLAAQTGATTKELMARLGHSSTRAAMIYQHTSAERDRRIAERLGAMVDQERRRVRDASIEPYPARGARVGHDGQSPAPRPAPVTRKTAPDQGGFSWSEPASIR